MSTELLDQAATKLGSYGAVARYLGVTTAMMAHMRHGRSPIPNIITMKLADVVDRERWPEHLLHAMLENAKTEQDREYLLGKLNGLRTIVAKASGIAAALVLSLSLLLVPNQEAKEPSFA